MVDGTKLVFTAYNSRIWTSTNSGASITPHNEVRNWTRWDPKPTTTTPGSLVGSQGSAIELLNTGNNQFVPVSFIPLIQAK